MQLEEFVGMTRERLQDCDLCCYKCCCIRIPEEEINIGIITKVWDEEDRQLPVQF